MVAAASAAQRWPLAPACVVSYIARCRAHGIGACPVRLAVPALWMILVPLCVGLRVPANGMASAGLGCGNAFLPPCPPCWQLRGLGKLRGGGGSRCAPAFLWFRRGVEAADMPAARLLGARAAETRNSTAAPIVAAAAALEASARLMGTIAEMRSRSAPTGPRRSLQRARSQSVPRQAALCQSSPLRAGGACGQVADVHARRGGRATALLLVGEVGEAGGATEAGGDGTGDAAAKIPSGDLPAARMEAKRTRRGKINRSQSETNLDRILRVGSMGAVNGTTTIARSLGGYKTLVSIKEAIDTTAGWKTPPLSGTRVLSKGSTGARQILGKSGGLKPKPDASRAQLKPQKTSKTTALNADGEWLSAAVERELLAAGKPKQVGAAAGRVLEEAKPPLTESDADRVGAAAQAALAVSDEDEESESDNVDAALDIKRTLLNVGLFVSHIAGWKGIWDFQDTWHGEGMPWYASVGIGVVVYLMRFKVDDLLDTHDVHGEDWFDLFEGMPELGWATASEYGKIYVSTALVFVSSLFIWRGIWTMFDAVGLDWFSTLLFGAASYTVLSVVQLDLEVQRSIDDPQGNRSPSLFTERDTLLTPLTLVPEEFVGDSSDESSCSEQSVPPPPPANPPPP